MAVLVSHRRFHRWYQSRERGPLLLYRYADQSKARARLLRQRCTFVRMRVERTQESSQYWQGEECRRLQCHAGVSILNTVTRVAGQGTMMAAGKIFFETLKYFDTTERGREQ